MSESDQDYDPAELKLIREKMKALFPPDTDLEQKLYHTIREYNTFDKEKLNELFSDSFRHFSTQEVPVKSVVTADIQEIMEADGKVVAAEKKALKALMEIIDETR